MRTGAAVRSRGRLQRIAGLCGLAAPVFTLGMIFAAVAISPWFSWQDNALSDMGVSPSAIMFNLALIVGGLLNIGLALGVGHWVGPGLLSRLGSAVLLIAAVMLFMIGMITEEHLLPHVVVAASYFLLTPVSYLLLGVALFRRGVQVPGLLTIAAGVAALVTISLTPHHVSAGIAVPEILTAMIISCWSFSMGTILLVGRSGRA